MICATGFASWISMIPLASLGSVYSVTVAYENNQKHFHFAAQAINTCRPANDPAQTCSATLTARNYGCPATKAFATAADGKAVYSEVSSVSHQVLSLGIKC